MSSTQKQMIFGIVAGLTVFFAAKLFHKTPKNVGALSRGLGISTMKVTDKDIE